ncbi:MAG: helix-turn-helix domain-containing protein [Pseudomonadota bacterium]
MKEPKKFAIDAYLVDVLIRDLAGHNRTPSAFLVYLWLSSKAQKRSSRTVAASLQMIAAATGLSKSSVSHALNHLRRKRLIETERDGPTEVPRHRALTPWKR